LGPISLPAPQQGLGGREAHSVLGYLTDGSVWSDWFLPGLHHGFWIVWPLLAAAALAGLVLCLWPERTSGSDRGANGPRAWPASNPDEVLVVAGLVGLATALAWLLAPTSASGPDGMPRGFESGLRYLAPALVLGLALLPVVPLWRRRLALLASARTHLLPDSGKNSVRAAPGGLVRLGAVLAVGLAMLAVIAGYPIQRHYLQGRYANPSFTTPGLDAAFKWASGLSGARIATTSTRQFPLFGTDLSNHVAYVGTERPHGGFEAPSTCRTWREELNKGHYDYVVTTRDRLEPGRSPYPPEARWTEAPQAKIVFKKPPTVVFRLTGPLDPSSCPS
ncbi:MAG TPA: hypothetical protein VHM66_09600, partial [Solirubrobacterales bacterium]|nr:hypothetical protein [Solirubrobacterales bacterium]